MDEDLKRLIEGTAAETRRHFDRATERLETKVTAVEVSVGDARRHFGVVAEQLQTQIKMVAEGVTTANERIDRLAEGLAGTNERMDRLELRVDRLDLSMKEGFVELGSMIKLSYAEIYRRMTAMEQTQSRQEEAIADLQSRVERLEGSTH